MSRRSVLCRDYDAFPHQYQKTSGKNKELTIETMATSHGPIYNQPEFILKAYREWVSDTVKNEVILLILRCTVLRRNGPLFYRCFNGEKYYRKTV